MAHHAGLPTRLLDWCEGALIGLHFPRKEDHPAVWMLNPLELNDFASNRTSSDPKEIRVFPFVRHQPDLPIVNPAFELREPWELNSPGVPVARGYLSDMRSCTVAYPTRVFHHIRKAEGLNPSRRVEKSVLLERGLHDRQRCCSRGILIIQWLDHVLSRRPIQFSRPARSPTTDGPDDAQVMGSMGQG